MTSRGFRRLGAAMVIAFAASVLALVAVVAPTGAAPTAPAGTDTKTQPVLVTNAAGQAVPVVLDGAGNAVKLAPVERFLARKGVTIEEDSTVHNGEFIELFTVPAGKRFVADFVSATGDCFYMDTERNLGGHSAVVADGGNRMEMPLEVLRGDDDATAFFPVLQRYGGPLGFWADAGAKVYWQVRSFARSCVWNLYLSGHYEPLS